MEEKSKKSSSLVRLYLIFSTHSARAWWWTRWRLHPARCNHVVDSQDHACSLGRGPHNLVFDGYWLYDMVTHHVRDFSRADVDAVPLLALTVLCPDVYLSVDRIHSRILG